MQDKLTSEQVLQLKGLEAFAKAADGKATKIIIPAELQGIAGMLMHGIGGGSGGGMGGMGGMMGGGQQQNPSSQSQTEQTKVTDEYDVDRWKRVDGLDEPTLVQQVRADWDQKNAEKAEKSPFKRMKDRFSRRKKKEDDEYVRRPAVNNTVTMPDMQRTQTERTMAPSAPEVLAPTPAAAPVGDACRMCEPNYLGLTFQTGLDDFFASDPLNSAILAVDSLSMSGLTFSQVAPPVENTHHCRRMEHHAQMVQRAAQQAVAEAPTPPPDAPIVAHEAGGGTPYMDGLRESEERQKYSVRIPR